mgnify:CR=1 FL=1
MKKIIRVILALLLCAVLLSGCGAPMLAGSLGSLYSSLFGSGDDEEIPRFSQMVYERPQGVLDDMERRLAKLEKALDKGGPFRAVTNLLDLCYEDYYHFDTMYCLAEIRSCLDMTDEYYAAELSWCQDAYYDLQEMMEDMYYLCGGSTLAARLEKTGGTPYYALDIQVHVEPGLFLPASAINDLRRRLITALKDEEQQEICNQLNRRTEFIVLRTTYGLFDTSGITNQSTK